jgi:ABC-type multidrug transport system fused ATPase/permease subunit
MYKTYTLNNEDINKIIQKFNIYTDNIYTYTISTNKNTTYNLPNIPDELRLIIEQTFEEQFINSNEELYKLIPLLTPNNIIKYNIYNEIKTSKSYNIKNTIDLHRIILYFNIDYTSSPSMSRSSSSIYRSSSSGKYIPYELNKILKLYINTYKIMNLPISNLNIINNLQISEKTFYTIMGCIYTDNTPDIDTLKNKLNIFDINTTNILNSIQNYGDRTSYEIITNTKDLTTISKLIELKNILKPIIEKYTNDDYRLLKLIPTLDDNNRRRIRDEGILEKLIKNAFITDDNKNILKNQFPTNKIPINNTVGIVGPSGSGKSTIIDIILGLLIPAKGNVLIDNQILTKDNIGHWQNNIGFVPQDIFLLDGSIKENIAFGIPVEKIIGTSSLNEQGYCGYAWSGKSLLTRDNFKEMSQKDLLRISAKIS